MTNLVPSSTGSNFYISSLQSGSTVTIGYLLPDSVTTLPDGITLADCLSTYSGRFTLTTSLDSSQLTDFVAAAKVYFANSANTQSLITWFDNAANPTSGLTGVNLLVDRDSEAATATVTRLAQIQFANFSVNITPDTTISVNSTGDALTFASAGTVNSLSVTPFGERDAVALDFASGSSLSLLANSTIAGCLQFSISVSDEQAASLDVGLRTFTAPESGGYAATARHNVLNFSNTNLNVTLDPLAATDNSRSFLAFADSGDLTSNYLTAAGDAIPLTPQSNALLIFSNRLFAVDSEGNPVETSGNQVLYLAPAGDFSVAKPNGQSASDDGVLNNTLMGGLSAIEYLDAAVGTLLSFTPNQNAFARTLQSANDTQGRVYGTLTNAAQTSWMSVSSAADITYFAQPDSSVMHQQVDDDGQFLNYYPLAVGTLVGTGAAVSQELKDTVTPYPVMPYKSVELSAGFTSEDLAGFEAQIWSPQRRNLIQQQLSSGGGDLPSPPYTTTQQGLLLQLSEDNKQLDWSQLTLGNSPSTIPADRSGQLLLGAVKELMQEALQSNQLFLVATAGDMFSKYSSIPYALTQERLNALSLSIKDDTVITALQALVPIQWPSETALQATLKEKLSDTQYQNYYSAIRDETGDFSLFIADWEFSLSPWQWISHNSIFIFKFCNKQLSQVMQDTSQWSQPDGFNTSASEAQQRITDIFNDATDRLTKGDNDFAFFVNTVMNNASWNGVLMLNAKVPLSGLPPQMEGLAAGIDTSQFKAHHMGINVTPVVPGDTQFTTTPSSTFALIDYEDQIPLSGNADYDFKVNSLKVRIANSEIVSFSSEIEILINALFNDAVQQQNASDNNLVMQGSYQQSGGVGTYIFETTLATSYQSSSSVVSKVGIQNASFITAAGNDAQSTTVSSQFVLNGNIEFIQQDNFDLFSYGSAEDGSSDETQGLSYTALSIDMSFDQASPQYRTFQFNATKVSLDSSASTQRSGSLAAHFPMQLTGLTQATGNTTPDSLGFMPVDSPIQGSNLSAPWFGLNYDLDLGSAGDLAGDLGFTARLLLGWGPSTGSDPQIFIGLALPGVSGGERAISIEGVLKLAFGEVTFIAQAPTYILKLGNIALKFFSLSFPPNGQVDMLMFGNPAAQTSGALGWYASYVKNGAGDSGSGKNQQLSTENTTKITAQTPRELVGQLQNMTKEKAGSSK